jgi:hypothetical protein
VEDEQTGEQYIVYTASVVFAVVVQTIVFGFRKLLRPIQSFLRKIYCQPYGCVPIAGAKVSQIPKPFGKGKYTDPRQISPSKTQMILVYRWMKELVTQTSGEKLGEYLYENGCSHFMAPGTVELCESLYNCTNYSAEDFLEKIYPEIFTNQIKDYARQEPIFHLTADPSKYPISLSLLVYCVFVYQWQRTFEGVKLGNFLSPTARKTLEKFSVFKVHKDPSFIFLWNESCIHYQNTLLRCPNALYALCLFLNIILFIQRGAFISTGINIVPILETIYGKQLNSILMTSLDNYGHYLKILDKYLRNPEIIKYVTFLRINLDLDYLY